MSGWVVLLHVAVAFWFVAGLLGRNLILARARSSRRIGSVDELVELAGRFDRLMVIPGSLAVLLLGLLAFVPRRRVVDRALADARQLDAATPALSTALRDPVVAAARALELVVVAAILALMVVKPF